MSTPSTDVRVAELIRDLWPHRMSGEAARGIRRIFLNGLAAEVRAVNVANGWFDDSRSFGDGIALLHSEVSEALEAFRSWRTRDATGDPQPMPACCAQSGVGACDDAPHLPKPEGVGSELADVLIRLLDECDRQGIDLQAEFDRKLAYNATRGHKHGGKSL
jgi:NTP pyrophosphatase (non-canonical NTP hydrolase)